MKYDIEYINPMGSSGVMYALEANSPREACDQAPYWLASSSQWRPDQFTIVAAKISIYEDKNELCKNKHT